MNCTSNMIYSNRNQIRKLHTSHSTNHSTSALRKMPVYDYRVECDIPKFCDLNQIDEDYRFSSLAT